MVAGFRPVDRPPWIDEETKMKGVFKTITSGVAVIAASLLLVSPVSAGPSASSALKLGGAWVASDVDSPLQWSYTVSADPSGRRGTGYGTINAGLYVPGISELADLISPFVIDLEMTGKDTVKFNSVWYGLKKLPPGGLLSTEVAYIGMNWGELKIIGPDRAEGTHHIEFYLPFQDADGDGLPDPGQDPVGGAQVYTIDVRVGQR
jgi:hypothetical protein